LGGWTTYDLQGVSNHTWDYMMGIIGVSSLLDIGCGRGISTSYFHEAGARVLCVEGSVDAIEHTFLPSRDLVVNHDYTRGPYWPDETFDACWSVEVLEHLSRQYISNYMPSFRRCALVFVTSSLWGGHHHVEVHPQWWWKAKFEAHGMKYLREVTKEVRGVSLLEKQYLKRFYKVNSTHNHIVGSQGLYIHNGLLVFVNPEVASLPRHDHEFGNVNGGKPCLDKEDLLPRRYVPLKRCTRTKEDAAAQGVDHYNMWWHCVKQPSEN